uniref:Leucine-rich repeat flightless-interacting protein 1 n=1 Tax=Kryptolebias marmoratus TaxID=37003 RepID=A0A3Q3FMZ3_KRYMA
MTSSPLAEARLAVKRAARAEAREIRLKELERQQKEVEDKDYPEKGSRAASALTATTLTSLGGTSSRRGSGDTSLTVHAEIKDALAEAEEKYRKAMVSNAQLDNEKNNLMYQVDTLKDSLMELEELLSESRREHEEKLKEFEREKHAHAVLQFQFAETKETLKQSEELLNVSWFLLQERPPAPRCPLLHLPGEPEEGITSSEEPGTLRGAEDVQEREEPLETENIEPVEPPESFCPQEPIMDRVSDELGGDNAVVACEETANEDGVELGENQRNKEDSLEEPAESSPRVEGSEGTVTDGKTGEAEEKEPVVSPQITEDLSSGAETSDRGPDHTESKTLNETIPEPEKSGADGDVVEPELAVAATSTSAAPPLIHPDPGPEENWADDGEPTPKTADEDETEPGAPPETDGSERRRPSLPTEDGTGSTNQADSRPETKAEDLSPTQSSEETEPASPEPSNAQQDQETGPAGLGPRAEQMDEDSGQEAEDIDPPRASQQDGHDEDDDEDDDEEEGQSFDFDDLDMEAAIESNVSIIPEEEDVEEGLEVKSDEDIVSSGLGQTDPEDKPADGGDEVDHLVTEPDAVLQEKQNSLPPEDVCEEEEKRLGDEESAVAPGDVSASVKKGLDVIELDLESPKTGEDNVPNREAPQSGKDAKKSTKKGKGKGKEDCKMS